MSSILKNIWIDGKIYKILKTFDPAQVEGDNIQLIENVYRKVFNIPLFYGNALKDALYRNQNAEIKQENVELTIAENSLNSTVEISSEEEIKVAQSIFHLLNFVSNTRSNVPAKQFLSVPVLNEEIKENFQKFKENVLALRCEGVDENIFQKHSKLHFSINVFSLVDDQEIDAAKQALIDCKTAVIMPYVEKMLPLKLDIRGIDCMQPNHSKVRVLYAKAKIIDENLEFNFQKLMDAINEFFHQRGLIKDSLNEHVKIHMTLINTKYGMTKLGRKRRWRNIPINATNILTTYKDFYFGQTDLNSIHLCLISSSGDGGYYKILSEINW